MSYNSIEFSFIVILSVIIPALVGFIVAERSTPLLGRFMRKRGQVGVDVHKPNRPLIPETVGIGIVIAITVSALVASAIQPLFLGKFLGLILVVIVAGVVGAVDAVRPWGGKQKVVATALTAVPILVVGAYSPFPEVPFVGSLRMTILYPVFFIPVFMVLLSNATNMIDILNGAMPTAIMIPSAFLLAASVMLGRLDAIIMLSILISVLYGYYRHNRYPATVFGGDVGSLGIGAAVAGIGIMGGLETITLIAFLPLMINGSLNLSSIGRLFERREVKRPTYLSGDLLAASRDEDAPITMTRFLLARQPMTERQVVGMIAIMSVCSGVLALATAFVMVL